jgi:hypothetical protein
MAGVPNIGALQPLRQVGFAGRRFQHDMALHQRVDAVGAEPDALDNNRRPAG